MQTPLVKDIMVPLAGYATVPEEATLHDAVMALEKAQAEFDQNRDRHRAILVLDKNRKVVGKISQLDIMRALEPRYGDMGDPVSLSRFGYSREFMSSMLEKFKLWETPVEDICRKSVDLKVTEFMYLPSEGEYVEETATLTEAIHLLVMGHHQSLLVTKDEEITGILRLTDVFKEVTQIIKNCIV